MRRTICTALILCLACTVNFVFAVEAPSENLFQKGLAAYQNKQFSEARDDFQKLIEANTVSPALLHNLALTYVQLNEPPMALALWRKALTLEPSFAPARAGREYIEAKLQTRGFERDRLSESVRQTMDFISFYESLWLIILSMTVAGALWIRYWANRRHALEEEAPRPPFPASAVVVSIVFASAIGLSLMKLTMSLKTRATIVTKKASARSLPTADGVSLFELNGGTEVLVRRRDSEWSQVLNSEGSSGWVANKDLFVTSQR